MKMPTSDDYAETGDAALRMLTVKRLRSADQERLMEMSSADAVEQITDIQQAAVSLFGVLQEGDVTKAREHWLDLAALCLLRAEIALHEEQQS